MKISIIVHSANDANVVINSLSNSNLRKLSLTCFVNDVAYSIFFDLYSDCILLSVYPFRVKVNCSLRQKFCEVVNSLYDSASRDNFL